MQLPKQIIDSKIPYDPDNNEAYVYKLTNLIKNMYYGGYHKGKPSDGYICSSENKKFHSDFMEPESQWFLEVIAYGDEEYCKAVEHRMLEESNAKDSDDWYNDTNGGSKLSIPRINLVKSIAKEIRETKSYKGITPVYRKVKDIPKTRLQIREFTLDDSHIVTLRNIINTKQTLDHLIWVSIKDRTYRGMKGELGVDGNHSIESAETSDFGGEGQMPNLAIPDSMLPNLTDDEIDYLAMYLNPRQENPTLPTDLPTIARQVCNMRIKGINANSKEVQDIYHDFHLTKAEKTKVSKLSNDMFKEIVPPNELTWINYGAGDEKRQIDNEIEKEQITNDNRTGVWSKCYSTAKYNAWADLHDIINWNHNNPHNKVNTYKIRFYHPDKKYKDSWIKEKEQKNIIALEGLLKPHNIKREWVFLKEQRDKLTRGGK
jgi:hypothetical protein